MKKINFCLFFLLISLSFMKGQLLIEDKNGDVLFQPMLTVNESSSLMSSGLIKLNTGDQSIGFDYYNRTTPFGQPKYKFWTLGVKVKPTEGYAAVFKNGQFSPGINISGSLNQVKIFDREATKPENNFLDWGSIYASYSVNKYQLYKSDTTFKSQLSSKSFSGLSLGLNYNMLIKSSWLISFRAGYSRTNNYNDLTSVEVRDSKIQIDTESSVTREILTTKTAKQGNYKEYDSYPFHVSLSRLTPDNMDEKSLTFGYSIYVSGKPNNITKPITDAGVMVFVSQMKKDVSITTIGLSFQFNDFFDTQNLNNGLMKRLSIGLTTNFPLFSKTE
ncbi:hypothetical protein [Chryseobacterium sp. 2987]|uniref:hypothetical protein n=1 Tax=Chryseobacterium sp. 2987 TaxID=2817767 RepID=UPI00286647D7|nr:hypothetical protein [Chryseobacterium sp. 2987]MDR6919624.1 hypothetical protein [Chryseobacterium sp. 2987]